MAIFKRRDPKKTHHKLRDALWPRIGWRRAMRYTMYRIIRIQDSDRNIAVGLSWGAAVSFTPLIGTHVLQAALYSWLMRGNIVASFVGTFWGNPWTGPFMQWFSYETGKTFFRILGFVEFSKIPDGLTIEQFFHYVGEHPYDLVLPWIVGGFLAALIVFPPFYVLHIWMVRKARAARHKSREAARQHRIERRKAQQHAHSHHHPHAHTGHHHDAPARAAAEDEGPEPRT